MSNYYKDKVVVGVVKDKSGKILLAKVKKDKLKDFGNIEYVFPGGRIENDEIPTDALEREILEETGYTVNVVGQISFRIHPVTGKEIYYYHCKYNDKVPREISIDEDIDSILWIERDELDRYLVNLNPDVSDAIASL